MREVSDSAHSPPDDNSLMQAFRIVGNMDRPTNPVLVRVTAALEQGKPTADSVMADNDAAPGDYVKTRLYAQNLRLAGLPVDDAFEPQYGRSLGGSKAIVETDSENVIYSHRPEGFLHKGDRIYFLAGRDVNGQGTYVQQNIDNELQSQISGAPNDSNRPAIGADSQNASGGWSQIGRLSSGLKIGSREARVADLQTLLGVEADGIYGPKTQQALRASFVTAAYAAAQANESSTGIPAAITTAQAILESSFGMKIPTDVNNGTYSYNLFGIKAGSRQNFVSSWTHEDVNGKSQSVLAKFASYDSFEDSVNAHSTFLTTNPRYRVLFSSKDSTSWANGLQSRGYASDREYASKLITVMNQWKLK
jgi:hypothetical protein